MDKVEGFLEVGRNENGEVIINHPDLKSDENGVGHIVFSVDQARTLAHLLEKQASEAELEIFRKREEERIAAIPPADRSKRCMLSGNPETPEHRELRPDGMQKDYVVLCPQERAKGFVRPVRRTYRHVGVRPKHPTRELTADEKQRYASYNYVLFEPYPDGGSVTGRFWTKEQLNSGCGTTTTMGLALAETYARDPGFYSGTFCCTCAKHFGLEEFVWEGTNEQVGS